MEPMRPVVDHAVGTKIDPETNDWMVHKPALSGFAFSNRFDPPNIESSERLGNVAGAVFPATLSEIRRGMCEHRAWGSLSSYGLARGLVCLAGSLSLYTGRETGNFSQWGPA